MAARIEHFKVTPSEPTVIEWAIGDRKFRGTAVLAVHGVVDKGDQLRTEQGRFELRISVAADVQDVDQ